MTSYWAPLLLIVVTGVLLVLPVAPALRELRSRQDAGPLPTSRDDGKITNFAESFQLRLEPLRQELQRCAATNQVSRIRLEGLEVLLVGRESFDFDLDEMRRIHAVMCCGTARVLSGQVINADVWSFRDLEIGQGAVLRAGVACRDVRLEQNSAVLRWLHAGARIYLRQGSVAHNRLSADQAIFFEPGCGFERVHAPMILVLESRQGEPELVADSDAGQLRSARESDVMDFFEARPRMRVQGDFVLPPGDSLRANVIATGEFRIERGASFFGSVKSYRDAVVAEGASVHGSIACGGTAYIGPDAVVSGPLMAEEDVYLSRGSCIGRPDSLATIAACRVQLSRGCRIHGTIWARVQGRVEA